MKGTIEESLRAFFSPEFLNRIDSTIVFKQLQKENMHKIIEIQLSNLLSRLEDKHITLELSEEAKDLIVDQGFDQKYGARPLKRVLQRLIEDKLAEEMLKETIGENSNVIVSVNDNKELVFKTTTKKTKSKNQRSKVSA
jgi:ATP-dependent Clp protease ATP-binding subunit ClpC